MDERKHLILLKGQNKTKEIRFIKRNEQGRGYDISFDNGKVMGYSPMAEPSASKPVTS